MGQILKQQSADLALLVLSWSVHAFVLAENVSVGEHVVAVRTLQKVFLLNLLQSLYGRLRQAVP
jgi:hypothetical protein